MEFVSEKNLKEVSFNKLPYFFFKSFEKFTNKFSGGTYTLLYSDKHNALMPVNRLKVKFFYLIQINYPPVTYSGERLPAEKEKSFLNDFVNLVKKKVWAFVLSNHAVIVFLMQCPIMPNPAPLEPTN